MPQYRLVYKLPVDRQDQLHPRADEEEERSQKTKETEALREQELALVRRRQKEEEEHRRRSPAGRIEDSPRRDRQHERYLQNEPWQCLRDVLSEQSTAPSAEPDRLDHFPEMHSKSGSLQAESCREKSPSPSQERSRESQRQERSLGGEFDQSTTKPNGERAEFIAARIQNTSPAELEISPVANIQQYIQNKPGQVLRDVVSDRVAGATPQAALVREATEVDREIANVTIVPDAQRSPSRLKQRDNGSKDIPDLHALDNANLGKAAQPGPRTEISLSIDLSAASMSASRYLEREPWHTLADVFSQPLSRHYPEADPERKSPKMDRELASKEIELLKARRDTSDELRHSAPMPSKPDSDARDIDSAKHREEDRHSPFERCQSIKPWQAILNLPAKTEERLVDKRERRAADSQSRNDLVHQSARQIDVSTNRCPSQTEQNEKTQEQNQLTCPVPIEIARTVVEIGPLERETVAFLQARYDHAGPDKVDVRSQETPRSLGEVPIHAQEETVPHKDWLSAERTERAQQQIEYLQLLDLDMESPREDEYATLTFKADSEHTLYGVIDMRHAAVREADDRTESQQTLEHEEITRQIGDDLHHQIDDRDQDRSTDDDCRHDEAFKRRAPVSEKEFTCAVPVDVAKTVIEIADLEPECLAFLQAQYGYAEPYVFPKETDHSAQISAQSLTLDAQESLLQEIDTKSAERVERAQGQIEFLQSVDRDLHSSPRYYEYAALTLTADSNTAVYHVCDAREASWARDDYPQALQQVLDQRADKTEDHVHDRCEEKQRRFPRAQPRKLLTTIERDLSHCENEVDRLEDEEPAPEKFYLIEMTRTQYFVEVHFARTIEEFNSIAPGCPADEDLVQAIVDVDRRYKLWLSRKAKARRQLQDKHHEECQHHFGADDYDYDDFDR